MSDDTPRDAQLTSDLAEYFALTTTTRLPQGVSQMSAATLGARRWSLKTLFVPAAALVGGAAVIAVGVTLSHGASGSSGSASQAGGAGAPALSFADRQKISGAANSVAYPGVDSQLLESAGHIQLRSPAGHGTPSISPATARATAMSAEGSQAGPTGPVLLAWVDERGLAPLQCLCWVVDLPVNSATAGGPAARTALVFIDATTGRFAGDHSGDGVP